MTPPLPYLVAHLYGLLLESWSPDAAACVVALVVSEMLRDDEWKRAEVAS